MLAILVRLRELCHKYQVIKPDNPADLRQVTLWRFIARKTAITVNRDNGIKPKSAPKTCRKWFRGKDVNFIFYA